MSACSRHCLSITASLSRRQTSRLYLRNGIFADTSHTMLLDCETKIFMFFMSLRLMMQPAAESLTLWTRPDEWIHFSVFASKVVSLSLSLSFCLYVSSFFTSTLCFSPRLPLSLPPCEAKRRRLVDYSNRLLFHLRGDYNGNLSEVCGWSGGWRAVAN